MEKNGLTKLAVRCYYVRSDIVCYAVSASFSVAKRTENASRSLLLCQDYKENA